jgi:hypothetical protein
LLSPSFPPSPFLSLGALHLQFCCVLSVSFLCSLIPFPPCLTRCSGFLAGHHHPT